MNTKRNEAIECYLHRIREEFYNLTPVDDFIETLRYDLYEYLNNNPDCTEKDLESEFGSPEEIAKDFLEGHKVTQPKQIAKLKRKRNIIIAVLIITLTVLGGYLINILGQQQSMATDVIIIEK
ncbi:MAG: hypothetical protein ACI4LC_01830 [Emergencia sp.]